MDFNPLITALTNSLFEAEKRRLNSLIIDINKDNKELKSLKVDGFMYGGKFYLPTSISTTINGPGVSKSTLHVSLYKEIDRWIADSKIIKDDHDLIKQMLYRLLKPCQTNQDIRDTLPECLVKLIPSISTHPRSEEPGYTLLGDERASRQFRKLLPKMELYATTRLFY